MANQLPKTLLEATRYFSDEQTCIDFVASLRWADGVVTCPHCQSDKVGFLATRKIWKCKNKECRKQFSVKVGTIFEDSAIKLDKWLVAIWLIANAKNGISSYELHRAIGITQKSAWFMLHRIRLAMEEGSIDKLSGSVESDTTYIGGSAKNMHSKARKARGIGKHSKSHHVPVFGVLERKGRVRARVIKSDKMREVMALVNKYVEKGSELYTDDALAYDIAYVDYIHETVNHSIEYVRDNAHTNSIENFWSLFKRTLKGTYVSIEAAHLQSYIEEQCFRYNNRENNDQGRFMEMLKSVNGKRITWQELIDRQIYWRARKITQARGY